jgi:hypothetical protein
MATGKKHATGNPGHGHGHGAARPAPQERNPQAVSTCRVVVIKDGVFVRSRQHRQKGLAS